MRSKARGEYGQKARPETPARPSHIHQAALQAPEPEDAQNNKAVCRGKQQMSILRMGAQQIKSAAA
jgi:hypothetical protein